MAALVPTLTDIQATHLEILYHWFTFLWVSNVQTNFKVTPLGDLRLATMTRNTGVPTVSNSRCQLCTTVLGATIRQVCQVASAGGNSLRFFHASRSCKFDTCLRRRFLSVSTPFFLMIAERKEITWMVFPVNVLGVVLQKCTEVTCPKK